MDLFKSQGLLLIGKLYPILFDHWVRQYIAGDLIDLHVSLLRVSPRFERNFEVLSLTHGGYRSMPQARQRGPDGSPLRIENCGFHGDVDASFHDVPL